MGRRTKQQQDDDIDYGATADTFASDSEEEIHSDDESENSVEEQDESEDSPQVEEGHDDEEEEEENDDDDDEEEERATNDVITESAFGEPCTFDLRNLLAMSAHQVNAQKLYVSKTKDTSNDELLTIAGGIDGVSENYLLQKATDGCTQLIAALWQLPIDRTDAGPLATLPAYDESNVPRALPPPETKKETKWEKFAKERGIALKNKTTSRKVWDELTQSWKFLTGRDKANNASKEWPIMEVKANEDPYADPWEKLRDAKRSKTEKNLESRLRNKERAGELSKGTTTKLMKSRAKSREAGKAGGNLDRDNVPTGVPVDFGSNPVKRGKQSTTKALLASQVSTASLGKFDKRLEGEPERKKTIASKKRKFESSTDQKFVSKETERNLNVLKRVIDGGGVAKERAIKKGKYAKGETAYDYEFDDGLGASSFRKKKGRAGAGKAKKMTKKRVS